MVEFIVNVTVSILIGVGLWAALPRGVVLTRTPRIRDWQGEPLNDTWELKNESALPVRITSGAMRSTSTFTQHGEWHWVELSPADDERSPVFLNLDDEVTEIRRLDQETPWSKVVILPGDTLTARVLNNTDLRIRYRRVGWLGIFERREVLVQGGA